MFYLYNGSRVLDLFENKTILIYQSVFTQIPSSLCHSGLITLSQTNQFSESCIVINIGYHEINQPTIWDRFFKSTRCMQLNVLLMSRCIMNVVSLISLKTIYLNF